MPARTPKGPPDGPSRGPTGATSPAGPQGPAEDLERAFRAAAPPDAPRAESDPPAFAPFETLERRRVYDSPWCALRRDWIRLPGGGEQDYHVFEVSNAVAVVPFLPDGRLLLIWQYRYPSGRCQWEVPAGRIHAGEDPAEAAARELLEETGHEAAALEALPGFFPTGGISAHYAHAYVAKDCRAVAPVAHDGAEQILVRAFARVEVERRLAAGDFADAFTALSLFYAFGR